jgi:hypothetical protein
MIRRLLFASLLFMGIEGYAYAQSSFPSPGGAQVNGAVQMCLDSSGNAVPVSSGNCASGGAGSSTFAKITDGTNTVGVTAPNTGPSGTQPALVTTISPNSSPITVNQGLNTQGAGPWLTQLYDGTNKAAIKGASSVPLATDPAQVVTLSPNSAATSSLTYGAATPITGNAAGTTGAVVGTLAGASGKTTYICGFDVSAAGGTASVGPVTVAGLAGSSMVYQLFSSASGVTLSRSFTPCIPASAANTAITVTTTADGTATAVNVNSWGYQQ